jgi:hypothetical protein
VRAEWLQIGSADGIQRDDVVTLSTKISIYSQIFALLLRILNIYNMLIQELDYETLNLMPDGQQQPRKNRVKVSIILVLKVMYE